MSNRLGMRSQEVAPPKLATPGTSVLALALLAGLVLVEFSMGANPWTMPRFSVALTLAGFAFAGLLAVGNWRAGRPTSDRMLAPSLLVFLGFAAAIIGDPDLAVQSLPQR